MPFLLAKFGGDLLRPSVLLLLLCWAGFWFAFRRDSAWGRRLLAAGLTGYLLILLLPVDSWALLPLEDRFPRPGERSHVDGIIVLGGAIATEITRDRGIPSLNSDAERMTEAVALARRHPEARLVFTGASGSVIPGGPIETDGARASCSPRSVWIRHASPSRTHHGIRVRTHWTRGAWSTLPPKAAGCSSRRRVMCRARSASSGTWAGA